MKRTMKGISLILAVFTVFSHTVTLSAADGDFPDIQNHWAKESIESLAEQGLISGMADGLFHPDDMVTTAQFVTMLLRSDLGMVPPSGEHWASGYMDKALERSVIEQDDIRRQDLPLIRRFAARIALEALHSLFNEADASDISAAEQLKDLYLCSSCVWSTGQLYVKGIMLGRPDGLFGGDDVLTRAEAAVIVTKIADPSARTRPENKMPDVSEHTLISADEAVRLLETYGNAILLDVRLKKEHDAGFIEGSVCIPMAELTADITRSGLTDDKSTPIIVYCQSGGRSQIAATFLRNAGYERVYDLGGIDDWPYDVFSTN